MPREVQATRSRDEIPPERPAHECSDDKEDHHQNTTLEAQHNLFLLHLPQGITPTPDSPPRDYRSRGYDLEGVGHNLRDSVGIFGLGPRAVWMEVRAEK